MNADLLNGVTDAADEVIAPQRASQAQAAPDATFSVNVTGALEVQIAIIQLHAERELAIQKPRLDEGQDVILAFSADLNPQPEFLAAARERRRMEQIEVALRQLHEAHDRSEEHT